jgi:Spy/CpxP family protein refolding chaperone
MRSWRCATNKGSRSGPGAGDRNLVSLVSTADADPSAVEAKTKEIGDLQAQIQRKSVERQSAVREVLTEEQKFLFGQQGLGYGWGRGPCGLGLPG